MSKKIKRNNFSLNKQSDKIRKRKEAKDFIAYQRRDARVDMMKEMTYAVAFVLRNEYGYGKKRTVDFLEKVYEVISDSKVSEVDESNFLFNISEIKDVLKEEIDLDLDKLIVNEANKHVKRLDLLEKKEEYEEQEKIRKEVIK